MESSQCKIEEVEDRKLKSFLSTRARRNKLQLFYGCFDPDSDLLRDETDPLSIDVITRYSAYSRDKNVAKKHVQDLILEKADVVHDALIRQDGRVYICGKIAMAQSVTEAIIQVIAKKSE